MSTTRAVALSAVDGFADPPAVMTATMASPKIARAMASAAMSQRAE
jgi:hypothetical protein